MGNQEPKWIYAQDHGGNPAPAQPLAAVILVAQDFLCHNWHLLRLGLGLQGVYSAIEYLCGGRQPASQVYDAMLATNHRHLLRRPSTELQVL